jgi:hypothetical protein
MLYKFGSLGMLYCWALGFGDIEITTADALRNRRNPPLIFLGLTYA